MPGVTTATSTFWVYVLESIKDKQRYIGFTTNLKVRLTAHAQGYVFATKSRLPMQLIYAEVCANEEDAHRREGYLKTTRGRRFLAKRLKSYYATRCHRSITASDKSQL